MPLIKTDFDRGPNNGSSSDSVSVFLDMETTEKLLKEANRAYNTDINDLMITALQKSFLEWNGSERIGFDLEGHGREDLMEGTDVSRTVGWFTTIYPVALQFPEDGDLASRIKYVKEKLHSIPHKGFNYGLMKYSGAIKDDIKTEISFNYLGQATNGKLQGPFSIESSGVPATVDGNNLRPNLIDLVSIVTEDELRIEFFFSKNHFLNENIEGLAALYRDNLKLVINHCADPENFDITPSDFDLVDLDQDELDNIIDFD